MIVAAEICPAQSCAQFSLGDQPEQCRVVEAALSESENRTTGTLMHLGPVKLRKALHLLIEEIPHLGELMAIG
jgi:hypothetical protein